MPKVDVPPYVSEDAEGVRPLLVPSSSATSIEPDVYWGAHGYDSGQGLTPLLYSFDSTINQEA